MISVPEAQARIVEAVSPFPCQALALAEAWGRVLTKPINASIPSPVFDNSAMDGYALRAADTAAAGPGSPVSLFVAATVPAGICLKSPLKPGEAMRIFTGAKIPEGADAVVKQEDVERAGEAIRLSRPVSGGENIRRRGEELEIGAEILGPGRPLQAAALALLAGFGFERVEVHAAPRVGILVTGSELVPPGVPLEPAQIYESNSFGLNAALQELGLVPAFAERCRDRREDLQWALAEGLQRADFLIVTGGVSVGDFDFVKEAAADAGVREVFWKVRQKPGKPVFFGKKEEGKCLFGLPGNPASALVCFYEYVRPALLRALGARKLFLPALRLPLAQGLKKKPGLRHFLKARADLGGAPPSLHILEGQGSHLMRSFAAANALAVLPEEGESWAAGDLVEAHLLPSIFQAWRGG